MTGIACGVAGIGISAKPGFPFTVAESGLFGVAIGALVGLVVWFVNRKQNDGLLLNPESQPDHADAPPRPLSAMYLLALGAVFLGSNHLLVVYFHRKWFLLVVVGALFSALGFIGLFVNISGNQRPLRWWEHFLSAVFVIAGLLVGLYLWVVVYR